jgi:hypothetical protein
VSEWDLCPLGDWRDKPWPAVPSSFLRWLLRDCDYVARRPSLAARVRQELEERKRPPGSVTFPGFEPS